MDSSTQTTIRGIFDYALFVDRLSGLLGSAPPDQAARVRALNGTCHEVDFTATINLTPEDGRPDSCDFDRPESLPEDLYDWIWEDIEERVMEYAQAVVLAGDPARVRYVIEDTGKWATKTTLAGPVTWTDNPLLRYTFDSVAEAEAFRVAHCGWKGRVTPTPNP